MIAAMASSPVVLALLATLMLLAGLRRLAAARRLERETGVAGLRVRQADVEGRRPARPMRCTTHGLVGRPDFLLAEAGALVPVEVKPTRRARRPYRGDLLQLAAYCQLVESETGEAPPYGVLVYADRRWEVPWTAARRQALHEALADLRIASNALDVPRSHAEGARCAACGLREGCGQALALERA
jgi:CRISPR-associated exonuclease Cas4